MFGVEVFRCLGGLGLVHIMIFLKEKIVVSFKFLDFGRKVKMIL